MILSTVTTHNFGVSETVGQTTLTFPSAQGFDCFETGDVVQDPDVKILSKNEDTNTIVVDGGSWAGSDGTGDVGDGRYEPSREWSAGETVTPEWRDFKKTFESAATGVGTYKAGAYGTGTIVFNPPLTGDIDVYVWVQGNQSSSSSSATFTDSAGNTETPTLEFTGTSGIGTAPQRVTFKRPKTN